MRKMAAKKMLLQLVNTIQNARGRAYPQIDAQRCVGCGRCKQVCHHDAIVGTKKQAHTIDAAACFRCYHCVEQCPKSAITVTK